MDFIRGKLSYLLDDFGWWIAWYVLSVVLLCIGVFLHQRIKSQILRKGALALLAVLATVLHVMTVAEAYYRYVFDEPDNVFQIATTQRWVDRHVVTNGYGFRDEHFFPVKAPEETRIGVFGDSFTWGQGIERREDLYDEILERLLSQSCPGDRWVKAYNFGKTGSDLNDYTKFLGEFRGFNMDAAVVGYYMNDIDSGKMTRHPSACYYRVFSYRRFPIVRWIVERSFALQYWWVRFYTRFVWPQYADACWNTINKNDYEDPEIWSRHLVTIDDLIAAARNQGQDLVIVLFPYLRFLGNDHPTLTFAARVERFLESRGIPVINLAPVLATIPPDQLVANAHDQHASELVHRIAAEKLYDLVKDRPAFSCNEEKSQADSPR